MSEDAVIKETEGSVVSRRGEAAGRITRLANHMRAARDPELRARLYGMEPEWKPPVYHRNEKIEFEGFTADFLTCADEAEYLPGEGKGRFENFLKLLKNNVRPESYENKAVLQLHGGGYYEGMHNSYRDVSVIYSMFAGGAAVLTPDYRTAPEDPYPAALEDALCSYEFLLKEYKPEDILFAGDSAGGGLELALALYLKDHGMPLPAGIIAMSAWTDLTKSGASYEEKFDDDPVFGGTVDSLVWKDGYYAGHDPAEPYISPLFGDMSGMPPMLMQVGDREMLLSDTLSVAEHATEKGVQVKLHVYPGMFHIFQMGMFLYPEAVEAWEEAGRFIKEIW